MISSKACSSSSNYTSSRMSSFLSCISIAFSLALCLFFFAGNTSAQQQMILTRTNNRLLPVPATSNIRAQLSAPSSFEVNALALPDFDNAFEIQQYPTGFGGLKGAPPVGITGGGLGFPALPAVPILFGNNKGKKGGKKGKGKKGRRGRVAFLIGAPVPVPAPYGVPVPTAAPAFGKGVGGGFGGGFGGGLGGGYY